MPYKSSIFVREQGVFFASVFVLFTAFNVGLDKYYLAIPIVPKMASNAPSRACDFSLFTGHTRGPILL